MTIWLLVQDWYEQNIDSVEHKNSFFYHLHPVFSCLIAHQMFRYSFDQEMTGWFYYLSLFYLVGLSYNIIFIGIKQAWKISIFSFLGAVIYASIGKWGIDLRHIVNNISDYRSILFLIVLLIEIIWVFLIKKFCRE
jgi:hypothetical protein